MNPSFLNNVAISEGFQVLTLCSFTEGVGTDLTTSNEGLAPALNKKLIWRAPSPTGVRSQSSHLAGLKGVEGLIHVVGEYTGLEPIHRVIDAAKIHKTVLAATTKRCLKKIQV